ncbi:hypothetical protein M3Y97_01058400 [Aphelenchoides bicaudatus]|nr:hypothetical protein M3Y97_01058400 [Aphelenchoides bicaudatus]
MRSKPKVHRLVQQCLQFNQDAETIFHNACKKLNYSPVPEAQIKQLIKCFYEYRQQPQEVQIQAHYRDLLYIVFEELQNKRTGLISWTKQNRVANIKLLNGRYLVEFNKNYKRLESLILHDIFYGIEREFRILGPHPGNQIKNKMLIVDAEHFIIFEEYFYQRTCSIYLVRLNFSDQTCRVLHSKTITARYIRFHLDTSNQNRFVVVQLRDEANLVYLHAGRINNDQMEFEAEEKVLDVSKIQIPGGDDLNQERQLPYAFRLSNNKLICFITQVDNNDPVSFKAIECDLSQSNRQVSSKVLFTVNENRHDTSMSRHFWNGNSCLFALDTWNNRFERNTMLSVNMDNQQLSLVYPHFVGKIHDIHVDEEDQLTLFVGDMNDERFVLHRISINQPDSLLNLSARALGRKAKKSNKKDEYEKLLEQFPLKLRPFNLYI